MTGFLLFVLIANADAYEFIDYDAAFGGCEPADEVTWAVNSIGFWIPNTTFMQTYGTEIMKGVKAWNAGPGTVNRGADWEYYKAGEQTVLGPDNGRSEIFAGDKATMAANYGLGTNWNAYAAVWVASDCSRIEEADILFDMNVTWHNDLPSSGSTGFSIGATAVHEAGHALGLGHEMDIVGVMYRWVFAENGNTLRLSEDDYNALTYMHPLPTSTGKNFMLTKWDEDVNSNDERPYIERWTEDEAANDWTPGACGTVGVADGPEEVWAIVNGTASNYTNIPIEWTLSKNDQCFDYDDITIGTRSPGMGTGTPYPVSPSGDEYLIPSTTSDDDYYVCAGINPDHTLSEAESSYADNIIRSEGQWTIDCP